MNEQEFKDKTKNLALRVIRLSETLPNTKIANIFSFRTALRRGAHDLAQSLCRAVGQPWRAVTLSGGSLGHDPSLFTLGLNK